jgi:hypothetical protein
MVRRQQSEALMANQLVKRVLDEIDDNRINYRSPTGYCLIETVLCDIAGFDCPVPTADTPDGALEVSGELVDLATDLLLLARRLEHLAFMQRQGRLHEVE